MKEEISVSNMEKFDDREELKVSDSALESAAGGVLADQVIQRGNSGNDKSPVHITCGTTLVFQQNLGVYYCPKCRKEVPFNEIRKKKEIYPC